MRTAVNKGIHQNATQNATFAFWNLEASIWPIGCCKYRKTADDRHNRCSLWRGDGAFVGDEYDGRLTS